MVLFYSPATICVSLSLMNLLSPLVMTRVIYWFVPVLYIFSDLHLFILTDAAESQTWRNKPINTAAGVAKLGIRLLCSLHSSVWLTISESQQILDGGLSSVCVGLDNCHLAGTQYPMPTVLVSCFQMQHILGIILHIAIRFPMGWKAILTPSSF